MTDLPARCGEAQREGYQLVLILDSDGIDPGSLYVAWECTEASPKWAEYSSAPAYPIAVTTVKLKIVLDRNGRRCADISTWSER